MRSTALVAAVAAAVVLTGCGSDRDDPSVLLISIDTLRADRLGCYGYARRTSPHIDALARRGSLFRRAYAPVPRTTQSVASMFTGLYPKRHGARSLYSRLEETHTTLAEILRDQGYATHAVVSNAVLEAGRGLEQGFDVYSNPERRHVGNSAREITTEALTALREELDGPFFLWVHYLDPHFPYRPPLDLAARFDPDYRPSPGFLALEAGELPAGEGIFGFPLPEADRAHMRALYDAEIAWVDAEVGRLLDGIPDSIRSDLLVVLTADHGESLGEHDYFFAHGEYLYEGTLRVPLLFVFPGRLPADSQSYETVSLLDVTPSILRLLGQSPPENLDGIPLFEEASDGAFAFSKGHDILFAETDFQLIHEGNPRYFLPGVRGRWSSARSGTGKLIRIPHPEGDRFEYYDLSVDPGELHPLPADHDAVARRLADEIERWRDDGEGILAPLEAMGSDRRQRLRELGYVE